jgi:hypothetical protein
MEINIELKQQIRSAMLQGRKNFGGTDAAFAKSLSISSSIYSRIKKGETEKVLSSGEWLNIGRKFQVNLNKNDWKFARTEVYEQMYESFLFCQKTKSSMILVDDCGIGKTECAKAIISQMKNAFYVDASQTHTKVRFIKHLALTLGCETKGKYHEVLENVKYALNILENPFICIDEAGDLEYSAYLELKGIMNDTVDNCAWFMIGADGLRAKITKGINNHKVGFAEIFSRFSDDFVTLVPRGPEDRKKFYAKLIGDVAYVNLDDKSSINEVIRSCMVKIESPYTMKKGQENGKIKSLRYLKTLVNINKS